jgi:two-component system, NarL family, sensor kinase
MPEPDLTPTRESVSPSWVVVARPRVAPPSDEGATRTGRLLTWLGVSALAALVVVAVVGVFAARHLAEREAVNDAAATADLIADAVIQPALQDGIVDQEPAAVAALEEAVRDYLENTSIVRLKLWTAGGTIVFSDEERLRGESFELSKDDLEVLADPQTRAEISDLERPENRFERGAGQLLEVYRPVRTPDGTALLFETYTPYGVVDTRSEQLWRGFAGVTVSSLLFFTVLLLPIGWRLLSRVRRAQGQREAALEDAVDASLEERRRIAGTLHDGVVQELAATSFAVAGAAARAERIDPHLADDLRSAAGTLRSSIGGLRSLLVDIYPANLEDAGFDEALDDLAASLRSRGVAVRIDLVDVTDIDAATRRLVFRVAQECLQNVRSHAAATHVALTLWREHDALVLDVVDDGRGFDPADVLDRPRHGHFGVRVLGDVVSAVGAELLVATAPGAGCHWRLRLPTPLGTP